jgi:hypothetical protein
MLTPVDALQDANSPLRLADNDCLGVDDLAFRAWYDALHPDDLASFALHGGTVDEARFVFAYVYLIAGKRLGNGATITAAWGAAIERDPRNKTVAMQAAAIWEHPAVIDLLDRLQYRKFRVAEGRIGLRYTAMLETLMKEVESASIKDRVLVLDTVSKFLRQMSTERQADRALRHRRAFLKAMETLPHANENVEPSENDLLMLVRAAASKLGREKLLIALEP